MHIEFNHYCPLIQSLFIRDSSLLRLIADSFGMTTYFCSGEGRVGDSLDESPTLLLIPSRTLSFRALTRNLTTLFGIC